MTDRTWTHDTLQRDLLSRRVRRPATMAWAEINVAANDNGRLDVYEVRSHDANQTDHFTGFEVKANTTDIRNDLTKGKWRRYLPICDFFYFAVPKGLIDYAEIPNEAGVIHRVGDPLRGRWMIARKAPTLDRSVTDRDIWKRLATRGFYEKQGGPPRPARSRLERMRDYNEMTRLSDLLNYKVKAELNQRREDLDRRERTVTDTEANLDRLNEQVAALAEVPAIFAALRTITNDTIHRRGWLPSFGTPRFDTVQDAVNYLTQGAPE